MTADTWAVLLLLACAVIIPAQIIADVRQSDRWAVEDAEHAAFVADLRTEKVA